jgi:TolB-like protein/tetratricopeptide (TPR) repeat protein
MNPERWRQIERLYNLTKERMPGEWSSFLAKACEGDDELRREVELLLAHDAGGEKTLPTEATQTQLGPGSELGSYRMEALLGAGGMGAVYRAWDRRLRRNVAIKVLNQSGTDRRHRSLLLTEARAAAALNHPGVVTIYEVGEIEDCVYLVMELVSGTSLRALLRAGPLELPSVLSIGSQIADALAAAHAAGVVHGDVKPENVVVREGGAVKLLDFGVASREYEDALTATKALDSIGDDKKIAGTLAYMAPERLRGNQRDPRSDLYALGIVLHEMAAGKRPFSAPTAAALIQQILNDPPPELRTGPPALVRAISRMLAKNVEQRHASASEIGRELRSISTAGEPAVVHPVKTKPAVAVLPFRVVMAGPDDQFLSAALADAVVNRLGATGKVVVRPTATVMRYAGASAEWTAVAREMNVDVVVEGSVQKLGPRLRVLVQAHQVKDLATIHSSKHDGGMDELFDLQDQIAEAVCSIFVTQKTSGPVSQPSPPTRNALAYELYMRATDRLLRVSKWDAQSAIDMLTQATERDPTFSDAWARLAQACVQMGVVFDSDPRFLSMAEDAVHKALTLDPANADAHCAQGQIEWSPAHSYQNRTALRALNAALKINPGCHPAQVWRGLVFLHLGLYTEARQGLEEALAAHPEDARTLVFLGHTAQYQGNYEEADDFITRAWRADPGSIWPNLLFPILPLYQGRPVEALEKLRVARQMLPEEPILVSAEGLVAAYEGDFKKAEQLADEALKNPRTMLHTHHLWHYAAGVFAMCGKPEKAVHWLRRCAEMGLPNYLLFGSDPHLRALHNRPEFLELMGRLRQEYAQYCEEFGTASVARF